MRRQLDVSTMFGYQMGGWASVVKATVLPGFNRKPTPAKTVTSESNSRTVSALEPKKNIISKP
jgi:hypothetical protein